MISRLSHQAMWAVGGVVAAWLVAVGFAAAVEPTDPSYQSTPAAKSPDAKPGRADSKPQVDKSAPGAIDPNKRKKLAKTIFLQLSKLLPFGSNQKSLDDFFMLGTADVNEGTGAADVRFLVKQGQRETADFLAEYILGAPEKTVRRWHVFYRLKGAEKADQALAATRIQYDTLTSYQEQIKKTYQATTVRRC